MTDVTYLNNSLCFQEVGEILLFQCLDDKIQVFFYEKRVHKNLVLGAMENKKISKLQKKLFPLLFMEFW